MVTGGVCPVLSVMISAAVMPEPFEMSSVVPGTATEESTVEESSPTSLTVPSPPEVLLRAKVLPLWMSVWLSTPTVPLLMDALSAAMSRSSS